MTEILDLTGEDKVEVFRTFIFNIRNSCGGLAIAVIIPLNLKSAMFNVNILQDSENNEEFYHWAWYDGFRFAIYIDKTLTDTMYFFGNTKAMKVKVING